MIARARAATGPSLNPPQREQFLGLLDRDLSRTRLDGCLLGLMVVHMSGVGRVNKELGYGAGDQLLASMVERITSAMRPNDLLVRIDGVDFALIMPCLRHRAHLLLAAHKIGSVCGRTCRVGGRALTVRPRIGAALAPVHAMTAESLLSCADQALSKSRVAAESLTVYETPEHPLAEDSLSLEHDLEAALDNNDLEVRFQPKIDLRDGRVLGVEALSRWRHPQRGPVAPALFVSVAEHSGLIEPLTQWNLNAALRCRQSGFPNLSVAVNLSPAVLNRPDTVDMIQQALAIWDMEPGQLVLEVTESAMIVDPPKTLATLHRLDDMGVKLSVDDFGTGYSSLNYLSELPVSELKIDQSYVLNMTEHRQSEMIVRAVTDLAHNLEMSVVAEGVEDPATLRILRDMGCDTGQGFLFGRPMAIDKLDRWLAQHAPDGRFIG